MVNAFKDLDDFFEDSLRLPMGGKTYVVPPPSFETGIKMKAQFELGLKILAGEVDPEEGDLDDDAERDLFADALGSAYDEMKADGVNWPRIKRAGKTAFYWIVGEDDMAKRYWETGDPMDPELVARMNNRADRRATKKSGSRTRKGSGAARKTR